MKIKGWTKAKVSTTKVGLNIFIALTGRRFPSLSEAAESRFGSNTSLPAMGRALTPADTPKTLEAASRHTLPLARASELIVVCVESIYRPYSEQ